MLDDDRTKSLSVAIAWRYPVDFLQNASCHGRFHPLVLEKSCRIGFICRFGEKRGLLTRYANGFHGFSFKIDKLGKGTGR